MRIAGKHRRRSIRIPEFDYTSPGAYFVTICTRHGRCVPGHASVPEVRLSEVGNIVRQELERTAKLRGSVRLDEYCIMPNHLHAIIWLTSGSRGTARCAPTAERFGAPVAGSLATVVRAFKSAVTRAVNRQSGSPGRSFWQRGYYEHVIKTENALFAHRKYIAENPLKWHLDEENPLARHETFSRVSSRRRP